MFESDDPRHGTANAYNYGCRCDFCREANRLRGQHYRKELRAQRLAGRVVEHGNDSTYKNYGCRCEPCVRVHAEKMLAFRESRRAKMRP